jgi:hydrogenase-4 component B
MMAELILVLSGLGLIAVSGVPACFFSRKRAAGQYLTAALFGSGSLLGLAGTFMSFASRTVPSYSHEWQLPWGHFSVSIDPLSAFFLVLVFSVPALICVYALGYWKQAEHEENARKLGCFFGLLVGSMAMVAIARDGILFLFAWEVMALSAFFALTAEDGKPEVRQAGWVYLVATHIGTLTLFAMFALWRSATGSFSLDPVTGIPAETASLIFILAFAGFSFKAGFMPLHVWLPGAHANAPSHVSALMSGVLLKMGVYGIVRMSGLLPVCPPWWGNLLIALGSVSGIFGIAFALGQRDLKRLLAYSSIENVGIIGMGIGLALLGRAYGRNDLVLLGMGGALMHVWNHGLFKPLLFLNSGAVIHAADTRDMEAMGGLAKHMPATALFFFVGAVSICALPPLNGFAGEWLLYLGLFKTLAGPQGLALAGSAGVALSMIGALAVAAFVKAYGTIFLGSPRSSTPGRARDPGRPMLISMAVLACLCVALGIFPQLASSFLGKAVQAWSPRSGSFPSLQTLAPQAWISVAGLGLLSLLGALAVWRKIADAGRKVSLGPTWDCGYSKPTARMQYTGTSFSRALVNLFSFALAPKKNYHKPAGNFPKETRLETEVADTVLERLVVPFFAFFRDILPRVYIFQQGQTHVYLLYILAVLVILFVAGGIGAVL